MAKKSLLNEVRAHLKDRRKYGLGRSKVDDKRHEHQLQSAQGDTYDKTQSLTKRYFYSDLTYKECCQKARDFWRWVNGHEGHKVPYKELKKYIGDYLAARKEDAEKGIITPNTLAKERSLLSKAFLVDLDSVKILPCSSESKKGRTVSPDWNPANHQDAVDFYCAVGARRAEYRDLTPGEHNKCKEIMKKRFGIELKPDLHGLISNLQPLYGDDGLVRAVVTLRAKHGRTNCAYILKKNRKMVTDAFETGKYKDYYAPSSHAQMHSFRRQYAQDLYTTFARDIDTLPRSELYYTRDGTHRVYDKRALSVCVFSLGHGNFKGKNYGQNRFFDVVHSYLR